MTAQGNPLEAVERLEALARRCTSGDPWYKEGDLCGRQTFGQFLAQDRAFIAAANPETILALISTLRSQAEALRPFAEALDTLSSRWGDHETHWQEALPRPLSVGHLRSARAEADTPPSAGPDAGLVERSRYMVDNPSAWDAFDQRASDAIRDLAAALEAAAEREGELRAKLDAEIEAHGLTFESLRQAEAQVADRDKRIAELARHLTGMLDAYELLCQQSGMNYHESPSSKYAAARQALSAIPTPGRE